MATWPTDEFVKLLGAEAQQLLDARAAYLNGLRGSRSPLHAMVQLTGKVNGETMQWHWNSQLVWALPGCVGTSCCALMIRKSIQMRSKALIALTNLSKENQDAKTELVLMRHSKA